MEAEGGMLVQKEVMPPVVVKDEEIEILDVKEEFHSAPEVEGPVLTAQPSVPCSSEPSVTIDQQGIPCTLPPPEYVDREHSLSTPWRVEYLHRPMSRPDDVWVPYPGARGAVLMKRCMVSFGLRFHSQRDSWPTMGQGFVNSNGILFIPGGPPLINQITRFLLHLFPDRRVTGLNDVLDTVHNFPVDWTWCVLHCSSDHNTRNCPCLQQQFPSFPDSGGHW
jgi:hypothetical protein